jgi:hypothetical protein
MLWDDISVMYFLTLLNYFMFLDLIFCLDLRYKSLDGILVVEKSYHPRPNNPLESQEMSRAKNYRKFNFKSGSLWQNKTLNCIIESCTFSI